MAMTGVLSAAFFIVNFAYVLRWEERAQTAADSLATAALIPDANVYNQLTILSYDSALEEYRLRSLLGMAVRINASTYYSQPDCDANYDPSQAASVNTWRYVAPHPIPAADGLPTQPDWNENQNCDHDSWYVDNALFNSYWRLYTLGAKFQQMANTPNQYTGQPEVAGGIANDPNWLAAITDPNGAFWQGTGNAGGHWGDYTGASGIDPAFTYAIQPVSPPNSLKNESVDAVSCAIIPPLVPFPIFKPAKVIGRSTATLIHTDEIVNPGPNAAQVTDPLTGSQFTAPPGACTSVNDLPAGGCSGNLVSYAGAANSIYGNGQALQPLEYVTSFGYPLGQTAPTYSSGDVPPQTANPLDCQGATCGAANPYTTDFSNLVVRLSWFSVGFLPAQGSDTAPC
jgi:hypothetical protein